jgi:signal transduction histidine kinase
MRAIMLFFLGTLAVVLVGFSITLYLLAKFHLHRQADERLESALNTLVAAAEVGPDGVEWESRDRSISIAPRALGDQLAWAVTDGAGHVVARSEQPDTEDLLAEAAARLANASQDSRRLYWQGDRWQANQRWLLPSGSSKDVGPPDPKEVKYPALVITTALPLEPLRTTLRHMAMTMAGVSAIILVVAVVVGRFVCRRALQPLGQMAAASRAMTSVELGQRLDHPANSDELEDIGRSFNGLLDRLQESFMRQKRFTGDASHQLRTPIAALLGQIEVALRHRRTPEEYEDVLATLHSRAGHLHKIVESLLYLARVDGDAGMLHLEELDLAIWVPEHVANWGDHPRSADIQCEVLDSPAIVRAHAVLLGELLNVLLDNACRYSAAGTPIVIRLAREKAHVELAVIDQGCGISPSELPHILEPFCRSSNSARTNKNGVGLGLAIAARLAQTFGGSLKVESQLGRGSRFTVVFGSADSVRVSMNDLRIVQS